MKNALILHGTDFSKTKTQIKNNWFPWLKNELEKLGYDVWLPELPEAWHPDLESYWKFLNEFNFNTETVMVGHSSGAAAMFGILHKLPKDKIIDKAISVAGFYKDDGWNCEGLFEEKLDWKKIKSQAKKIHLLWSPDDPYIKKYQTDYLSKKLCIEPIILENQKHFSVGTFGQEYKKFSILLQLIQG